MLETNSKIEEPEQTHVYFSPEKHTTKKEKNKKRKRQDVTHLETRKLEID